MNSILDTLSDSAKETLLSWCEDYSYAEVKKLAAKPFAEGGLDIAISEATFCRFFTTHGITESKEARAQYAASLGLDNGKTLLDGASEQLEQRLLELASRPNPGIPELRLLSQAITRLHALRLSERRVEVAEKRETRMATPPPAPEKRVLLSPAEIRHRVRVLLGKESPRDDEFETEETSHRSASPNEQTPSRWNSSGFDESRPAEECESP